MSQESFSFRKRVKSFGHAIDGLRILLREEWNARIHLAAMICAVVAGFVFHLSLGEWMAVVLSIGIVFGFELINTSLEELADFVCPERREQIRKVKDLGAAAVLVAALAALVVGLLVFLPKIMDFL